MQDKRRLRGGHKLQIKDVLNISRRLLSGEKQAQIAFHYQLHPSTISDIKRGKLWSDITGLNLSQK